ncbi:MAG: hypothetical protein ACT6FE_08325, partial [Methanosarcinaceae archaeon]
ENSATSCARGTARFHTTDMKNKIVFNRCRFSRYEKSMFELWIIDNEILDMGLVAVGCAA